MFLPFVAHVAAPISGPILHLSNLSSFWGAAQSAIAEKKEEMQFAGGIFYG
jgi:hypothetical protein